MIKNIEKKILWRRNPENMRRNLRSHGYHGRTPR